MLLEIRDLSAGYGRIQILDQVRVTVGQGEIVCLIGPNGAGKSTALRAAAGQIPPWGGSVFFDGRDVTGWGPRRKGRAGMIFIPQGENIFPNLSLLENLEIAGYLLDDRRRLKRRIDQVLAAYPWMAERQSRPARELSGGQRQALALGRILLLKPRLVLLDEPSLGLAPRIMDEIFERILELNREGVGFLIIEQNARKGLSVSHRGYVLEQGRNRLTGAGADLLDDERVKKLYLGG
jgi:ABC-type branched-subunit amino acid transport system ATPase component